MRLTKDQVEERIKLIQTPIDFDALITDGILAREGSWYRIVDPARVPEHVWVQIGSAKGGEDGVILFRFPGRST